MGLRTEQVEEYTVTELTIGQILEMQDTGQTNRERTVAMLGAAVYKDGKPIGAEALNLPARLAKHLMKLVTEMNNLEGDEDDTPKS